ncbi:MAG: histidine phosphatase family protein [Gammaproteobacteria bacterium]
MNIRLCLILAITLLFSGCAGPYTVVAVVRHAEKMGGPNPALTAAGEQRANALRDRLAGVNITGVYSTNTQRTRQTAQPLATLKGVPVTIYSNPSTVANTALNSHEGEAVLIVGHSNTVGDIVSAFGAQLPAGLPQPINEDDFDNIVIIVINGNGVASAVHDTYGIPSP